MREALVTILALLAIAALAKSSDIGKDGFNFYKDYLRGRSDEAIPEEPPEDRMIYFYRTPLPMYPSLLPALEQEYRKRTGNAFKKSQSAHLKEFHYDHMLSKELWDGAAPNKRSSKAALSFLMQGKHPYYANEKHYCPYGK